MKRIIRQTLFVAAVTLVWASFAAIYAAEPTPPEGLRAIFNGTALTGWYGLNPHRVAKFTGEKKEANLAAQRSEFPKNWTVENGELVNDGHGPYATPDEQFHHIPITH